MQNLTAIEARVIGVLLEKETTTPDQYPLTLNSLTLGCNQKSNRDPVMVLEESQVQEALDALDKKGLVMESRFGSRVAKYKHRFCNTEFSDLKFTSKERAVICVLLLRGAQTPGELRTRTQRMCEFSDVQETEACLNHLANRESDPLVRCLPREPGKRESRYIQLFTDQSVQPDTPELAAQEDSASVSIGATSDGIQDVSVASQASLLERIELLELRVEELEAEIEQLKGE